MNRKTAAALGSIAFLVALGMGPTPDAGAQTSPPPTDPCEGCGPSGTKNPGATQAWAYPEHHCLPDGTSAYSITFGLGKNAPAPAMFYARFPGQFDKPLGTINPGKQATVYPLTIVKPGTTIPIDVFAYSTAGGVPVQFGNGSTLREFTLTCPCEQPPPTTTPSTPSTPPPTATGSSVPGTSTAPPVSTVPGTPTTAAFQLPATGSETEDLAAGSAVLLFVGGLLWFAFGRKRTA